MESGPLFAGQPRQLDAGEAVPHGRHSYTPQKARTIGPSDVEVSVTPRGAGAAQDEGRRSRAAHQRKQRSWLRPSAADVLRLP